MIIIPSTFFTVSKKVHVISYNGKRFKPGETIEIDNSEIKNFDARWLIPVKESAEPVKEETVEETETVEVTDLAEDEPEEPVEEVTEATEPIEETETTEEIVTTTKRGRKSKTE